MKHNATYELEKRIGVKIPNSTKNSHISKSKTGSDSIQFSFGRNTTNVVTPEKQPQATRGKM